MSKLIKFLFVGIFVVVLLIVAAVLVLPHFIDPNDYKPEIANAIKSKTGRDIELIGDLNLSVFPWLGVKTGKISLANASGFSDKPFAKIDNTQVKVKLVPLLSKKVEVKTVVLKGLELNLAKNKKGVSNWDDLLTNSKKQDEREKKPKDANDKGVDLAMLTVGGVKIEDANIYWDDQQSGQKISVSGFNFSMDQLSFDQLIGFKLNFSVDLLEPKITEHVDLSGRIKINKALDHFSVSDVELLSNTQGATVPGKALESKLALNADVDLKKQTADVDVLTLKLKELTLLANLQGQRILDAPAIKGNINIRQFSPRKLMKALAIDIPETADADVLRKFSAAFDLDATTNSVTMDRINMEFDDTQINGNTKILNFTRPAISFKFDIDDINVDRYLAPKADDEQKPAVTTPAAAAGKASSELPLETLRKLNANGSIKIGQLKISGATAKAIEINIRGKNGVIQSNQTISNLYQGNYQGNFKLDARGNVPKISLSDTLKNIQVEPLLIDTTGKARISGTTEIKSRLSGRGIDANSLKRSLSGTIDGLFTDGAIIGIDIVKIVQNIRKALKGSIDNVTNADDKTEFSQLDFVAKIDNGLVNNEKLSIKSPFLRVNGAGKVNLSTENIDYQMFVKLVKSLDGQGGKDIKELSGVPAAVGITGTLSDLSYRLNVEAMLQEEQKALLREKKKELKAKIEEKKQDIFDKADDEIGPGTGKLLENLLGQ